ncbi:MAG: (Fe-S)-binding protein, partial [Trueperaceae bacterium]
MPRTVALFIPCYVDTLFPETGVAVVRVLERLGVNVDFPREQTCCGQMHVNTGHHDDAMPLVRRFVRAFDEAETIVAPSASCVALVRHEYAKLAQRSGDAALIEAVATVAPRVREFSEYLVDDLGTVDVGAEFPHAVTFHPTCHSLRLLRIGDRPQRLLRAVAGIRLHELPRADACCGFGGTFAVKNADTSAAMLADKMSDVLHTGAEVVVAADDSCLMQIGGGLSRMRTGVRTMHLAQVLAHDGRGGGPWLD